jgi:chromosomal replication initiator protein
MATVRGVLQMSPGLFMHMASEETDVSSELWTAALADLEGRYSKPIFQMWLRPMRVLAFNGSMMELGVQTKFARDWAENRLKDDIANTLAGLLGSPIEVIFTVAPDSSAGQPNFSSTKPASPVPSQTAVPVLTDSTSPTRPPVAANDSSIQALLNPRLTFEEFVVGNSNRFAHAAALAVAESPAKAYNPLFLYGGVGLGKTHLMHAIGHRVLRDKPNAKIVYVSSEKFTNEFIIAIKNNQTVEFRNKYRGVDVLLIDDIQFLEGKEQTLEEFFHTFNTLHESSRQLVISSDRPPREIHTLEHRLRSRFEMGLLTDIQPPDVETREAILRRKAESEQINVPDSVLAFIAKSIPSNIRELEGALIRVIAYASLTKAPIDVTLASEVLKNVIQTNVTRTVNIPTIKERVAGAHGLTVKEMDNARREARLAVPRQIAMYIACELTENSLPQIARAFGKKDHTTVMYARDRVKSRMENDEAYHAKVRSLLTLCQSD